MSYHSIAEAASLPEALDDQLEKRNSALVPLDDVKVEITVEVGLALRILDGEGEEENSVVGVAGSRALISSIQAHNKR